MLPTVILNVMKDQPPALDPSLRRTKLPYVISSAVRNLVLYAGVTLYSRDSVAERKVLLCAEGRDFSLRSK